METTWYGFTELADRARYFGVYDLQHQGAWNSVSDAYCARDLFRAGWLLSTIGTDDSRRMYEWTVSATPYLLWQLGANEEFWVEVEF